MSVEISGAGNEPNPNPAPEGTPAPVAGGTPNPNPNPAPAAPPAPGAGPKPSDQSAVERAAFIRDLQKERQQSASFKAQVDQLTRQVQALAGVKPTSPEDTEADAIRQRFGQIYPELAGLTKEDIAALRELKERKDSLAQTEQHYWGRHAVQMVQSVTSEIAKGLGVDTLSDKQLKQVQALYIAEAENDPEFLRRHEAGDPKLTAEFAKTILDEWFEPARRRVTANAIGQQRPVPNGRGQNTPGSGGAKKIDLNNPDAFGNAMLEAARDNGLRIGG